MPDYYCVLEEAVEYADDIVVSGRGILLGFSGLYDRGDEGVESESSSMVWRNLSLAESSRFDS